MPWKPGLIGESETIRAQNAVLDALKLDAPPVVEADPDAPLHTVLAVLPGRLKDELSAVAEVLAGGRDLRADALTAPHADWAEGLRERYAFTCENAWEILQKETGLVFLKVLEHAGVYKRDAAGSFAFLRFLQSV